jgi:hypothetical protein
MKHLGRFKPILEEKRETKQCKLPWYSLHWPRESRIFEEKKIITPNFAPINTFTYVKEPFYAEFDTYFITLKRNIPESIFYIEGLLNSKLLDYWCARHSKRKGERGETREYNTTFLSKIPIRRIDFDNPEDVRLHDEIVEKVKSIREKMAELAGYSKYFKGTRLTRLKSEDPLPDINPEAVVQSLPPEKRFSLRTHPEIRTTYGLDFQEANFILRRVGKVALILEGAELKLYSKGRKVLFINGEERLLTIIAQILDKHRGESWTSIKEMPLIPQNSEEFEAKKQQIFDTASKIRIQIQGFQKSIDTMVFRLYGVPGSLGK